MSYELKLDDVFDLGESKYVTLDKLEYNGIIYYFTNKLTVDEEPTKEFVVLKSLADGLVREKNPDILNVLFKTFSNNFNKKVEYYNAMKGSVE